MSARSRQPRLLIYSQDGLGLGHQRRTNLLAAEVLARRPDANVLTISDSPVGRFFPHTPGHEYLKLPSIRKIHPGCWRPVALSTSLDDVLALRKAVIRTAALNFAPDILLVDHMPHGAMGELSPTLEALSCFPVRLVLGLRDILDAPETIQRRWHVEGAFEAVSRHYHDVLVYGSRDVFDLGEQYAFPAPVRHQLRYCGYVCSSPSRGATGPVRRRCLPDGPDGELIVAMAGGGADAFPLFETLVRTASRLATRRRRYAMLLVAGPFMPEKDRLELQRLARGLPVHVVSTVSSSLTHLAAADLVVAMAGYNTAAEILSVGSRALLVPRRGPSAEQQMRASKFAERGWVRWLPPDLLSVDALTDAVDAALDEPMRPAVTAPDLRGRQRAAAHLLSRLSGIAVPPSPMRRAALKQPLTEG